MVRMYKQLCFVSLLLVALLCGTSHRANAQYDEMNVSYNDFYQDLSIYGQWIDDPKYGYVWSPDEDGSFRPYFTNGYWVMTDYGNTWVSNYPWGWACFHYGRWTYDNYYGWLWIPGSNWGPSWVSWRYNEGYFGWAPLGPEYEFTVNMSNYSCPNDWWTFIPSQYIYSGNYYRYWSGPRGNNTLITRTTIINNVFVTNNAQYVSGPHLQQVQQVSKQPVQIYKITNSTSLNTRVTQRTNTIRMYRPAEVRPLAASHGRRVAPPNTIVAPQPVRMSQTINTDASVRPAFRSELPRNNNEAFPAGTRVNEIATPEQRQKTRDSRPYEWDVNQSVPQPVREQPQQQTRPASQPQQTNPRGQAAQPQNPRQQAAPSSQPVQQSQPRSGAVPGRR